MLRFKRASFIQYSTIARYPFKQGNLEQVKYLIKNTSLNINRQDNHSNTGFHYACIKGHLPIVEYFKGLRTLAV